MVLFSAVIFSSVKHKKTINMSEINKAVIVSDDMEENMQKEAIDVAFQALDKFNIEKDIAVYIKKEFDKKHNPTWHCIVGRNFGSHVTHESKYNVDLYMMYQKTISFTFTSVKFVLLFKW